MLCILNVRTVPTLRNFLKVKNKQKNLQILYLLNHAIICLILWEELNVGTVPTFKMHNIGTVPTTKMYNVGTVPTFKMYNIGTVPMFKMHNVGTQFFYDSFLFEFGLYGKNK